MTKTKKTDSSLNIPEVITLSYIERLVSALKEQRKLEIQQINQILLRIRRLLDSLPNVLEINMPEGLDITVVGDIHGQFFDLLHIFDVNGPPSDVNPYLFNGDWVDRGAFGTEICLLLFVYKLMNPDCIHLQRGNHESQQCTEDYGFKEEVLDKYNQTVYNNFIFIFNALPIASVINKDVFVVHGGLFAEDGVKISDINNINRKVQPGTGEADEHKLMAQMLWADPDEENGVNESIRPYGCAFGPDITASFLRSNRLKLIIRSHQMCEEGFLVTHHNQLITLFSAPSYCGEDNKGAFIRIHSLPTSTSNLPPDAALLQFPTPISSPVLSSSPSFYTSSSSSSSSSSTPWSLSSSSSSSSLLLPHTTSVVSASTASLAFLLYNASHPQQAQSQARTMKIPPRLYTHDSSSSLSLPPLPRSPAARLRGNNRRKYIRPSARAAGTDQSSSIPGGFRKTLLPTTTFPFSAAAAVASAVASAAASGTSTSASTSNLSCLPQDCILPSLSRGDAEVAEVDEMVVEGEKKKEKEKEKEKEREKSPSHPHALFTSALFPELAIFQYPGSYAPPSKEYYHISPRKEFW